MLNSNAPKGGRRREGSALPSRYLTVADYADHFNVSQRTVRRRIAEGSIKIVRIGRSVRIPPSEIETPSTQDRGS